MLFAFNHIYLKRYIAKQLNDTYETNTNKNQQYLVLQGQKQKQQQSF